MHVIHNVDCKDTYDTLWFYTNDAQEIEELTNLANKIFEDIEGNACEKSELALIFTRFDFFEYIPDDYFVFTFVNAGADEYDPRFVNDKKLAKMVAEHTNHERVRTIADYFANNDTQVESFVQYTSGKMMFETVEVLEPSIETKINSLFLFSTPTEVTLK